MARISNSTPTEAEALDMAVRLLARRDHGEVELRRKLSRRALPLALIEATIERCRSLGYLNDESYSRRLAAELARVRHLGPRAIEAKLRERGLNPELAREATDRVEEGDEVPPEAERARQALLKRYGRTQFDREEWHRAAAFLTRRGYGWETIRTALDTHDPE